MDQWVKRKVGKILIVEDYLDTAEILRRILERNGFEAEIAVTGAEALEKVSRWRPEVIILDISLPDANGLDLIAPIRRELPETAIIVLTAYAELENAIRSVREGAADFIAKPFENEYLLHTVRRCLETKRLRERLRMAEKLRALGEMAAGIAHDFNNILSAMRAHLLVLKKRLGDQSQEEFRSLEMALKDGMAIVERLRGFGKKQEHLSRQLVDINELIRDAVAMTRPKWRHESLKKGHPIEIDLALSPLPRVMVNPSDIREVLVNLIFNAVEAMPQGGKITISSAKEADRVIVQVQDTGIGMDEETKSRIFDPFFTTKGHGSGLGLSLSYTICQSHGGTLEVESEPGKGSTFTLSLPVAPES
ncbi:response regulator [Thermosulfuriphilus ammonigenes]|uniref:histidine kinase n=1 Tax=Thermosulfuriphilus ammonigenes TaxID=1936021 RepID=A0A6G7PXV4_9BACT|nr:ATP-binding protein [Thermosulfuriphilus ammonigenes]MBA2849456.1 signal transduction histidine kinase [Thermosulfuriphilus ammonigenes]QIJ72525.1 response regulator [Thermosulfuriphilus ammonigenes]